jgi:hypothetical protein
MPALNVVMDSILTLVLQVGNSGIMQDKFLKSMLQPSGLEFAATNNL